MHAHLNAGLIENWIYTELKSANPQHEIKYIFLIIYV